MKNTIERGSFVRNLKNNNFAPCNRNYDSFYKTDACLEKSVDVEYFLKKVLSWIAIKEGACPKKVQSWNP